MAIQTLLQRYCTPTKCIKTMIIFMRLVGGDISAYLVLASVHNQELSGRLLCDLLVFGPGGSSHLHENEPCCVAAEVPCGPQPAVHLWKVVQLEGFHQERRDVLGLVKVGRDHTVLDYR